MAEYVFPIGTAGPPRSILGGQAMSKIQFPTGVLLLLLFFFPAGCSAQEKLAAHSGEDPPTESSDTEPAASERWSNRLKRGEWEYSVVPSFAPMQPIFFSGRKEYETSGRSFGMLNFQVARTIGTAKGVTVQYFFEFTPVAIAFNNELRNRNFVSTALTPNERETVRRTAFGAGFQPANFRFLFRPSRRIKPFVQVGAGMMFFNQNLPVPDARASNFTGDFGGGLHILNSREGDRRAMTIGFRYFHISNFNISNVNPGYNAGVFYVGYSFLRK